MNQRISKQSTEYQKKQTNKQKPKIEQTKTKNLSVDEFRSKLDTAEESSHK